MFSAIIGGFIGGCIVGAIFTLTWCSLCYITPVLTPYLERLFNCMVSIDSKVKRLSERLKHNHTASIEAEAKLKELRRVK